LPWVMKEPPSIKAEPIACSTMNVSCSITTAKVVGERAPAIRLRGGVSVTGRAAASAKNRPPRRECWIPVAFPAPVASVPNSLRHFRDREKAQLPQAFPRQAWGFDSGTLRQIALRTRICLRSLRVGHFTLQAFLRVVSVP
jgi:hypothetical protein